MGIFYDILAFIVGFVIYVGGGIGIVVWLCVMIRFAIGTLKGEPFDPFGRKR